MAPPIKKPSDCKVLKTPRAVPRACCGAAREAMLGWHDSKILKPQKNANSSQAIRLRPGGWPAAHHSPTCTRAISPTEQRNTARK